MNDDLARYYQERAPEYDQVYQHPAEQPDLAKAAFLFREIFRDKSVLELACGTGYWTAVIGSVAASLLATDINENLVEMARARVKQSSVNVQVADLFQLNSTQTFDALFAGFIWSHVQRQEIDRMLDQVKRLVRPGGDIVFIDSLPVPLTSHDKKNISRVDAAGNSYQIRKLANGSVHEVLKNFPAQEELTRRLSRIANHIRYTALDYYWMIQGKIIS